jgi:hypothetical protein
MRRISAGFVCFACICLWHGMDLAVIVWSSLNFFGVSSEIIANSIYSTKFWDSIKVLNELIDVFFLLFQLILSFRANFREIVT